MRAPSLPALLLLISASAAAEPLTLQRAVELARQRNERVQIGNERAVASTARLARARAFFFPSLTASGTYTRRANEVIRATGEVAQRYNALSGNVTLGMTIFDASSIPLYRSAAAEAEAAQHEAVDAARLMSFEAADAFLRTLAVEQVHGAAERRLELARKSLEDARARFGAQLVSSNDVTKAELDVANAERSLIVARNDVTRARLQLGFLLDVEPPEEIVDPAAITAVAGDAPSLVDRAQKNRPDLMALDARTRSARLFAQEPLMRLAPTLSLVAQLRGTNEPGFAGRTVDGNIGVTLTWVLFDGGERYAERDERRALAKVAELNARQAQRQSGVQVKTALANIETAQAAVKQAEVAAQAAQKNAAEVTELYRQGLASALDAQNARVQLFEAEVAFARSKYDSYLATLDLNAALGLDALGKSEAAK